MEEVEDATDSGVIPGSEGDIPPSNGGTAATAEAVTGTLSCSEYGIQ